MYYDSMESPIGKLHFLANEKGLLQLDVCSKNPFKYSELWQKAPCQFIEVKKQINAYFCGKRKVFELPLALTGTDFQQKVWRALMQIPYGETRSYGQIAASIGKDKACRAVGMANNKNPIPLIIPCHRVIGSNGNLTGFSYGLEMKQQLLSLEQSCKNIG